MQDRAHECAQLRTGSLSQSRAPSFATTSSRSTASASFLRDYLANAGRPSIVFAVCAASGPSPSCSWSDAPLARRLRSQGTTSQRLCRFVRVRCHIKTKLDLVCCSPHIAAVVLPLVWRTWINASQRSIYRWFVVASRISQRSPYRLFGERGSMHRSGRSTACVL